MERKEEMDLGIVIPKFLNHNSKDNIVKYLQCASIFFFLNILEKN